MNRDEIIRMARESGLYHMPGWMTLPEVVANLERFAALVAAAEREACAKTAEELIEATFQKPLTFNMIAAAIRARGGEPEPAPTPQEPTPDYLEKCPNCNGPADNGFDRSWPDPNPYFCTKCMKAMEY